MLPSDNIWCYYRRILPDQKVDYVLGAVPYLTQIQGSSSPIAEEASLCAGCPVAKHYGGPQILQLRAAGPDYPLEAVAPDALAEDPAEDPVVACVADAS